jgi:hypothetical protein
VAISWDRWQHCPLAHYTGLFESPHGYFNPFISHIKDNYYAVASSLFSTIKLFLHRAKILALCGGLPNIGAIKVPILTSSCAIYKLFCHEDIMTLSVKVHTN